MRSAWVLVTILLLAPAMAAGVSGGVPLDLGAGNVAGQVAAIRRDLAEGKVYAEIGSADRLQVERALARISELDGASAGELLQVDRVSIGNDQALVNTILTQAREDSRLICKRERSVGSNRLTSQCMTVAQRRAMQRSSQNEMTELQRNKGSVGN